MSYRSRFFEAAQEHLVALHADGEEDRRLPCRSTQVWWCQEHRVADDLPWESTFCGLAVTDPDAYGPEPCRMVWARVVIEEAG